MGNAPHNGHYSGPADTLDMMLGRGVFALQEFCIGNTIKYLHRLNRKVGGNEKQDSLKALFYAEMVAATTWWLQTAQIEAIAHPCRASEILAAWRESRK